MIVNIRGTNGSGKSTIVRKVMDLYPTRIAIAYPEVNKRKPMGYICSWSCSYPDCSCTVSFPKGYKPSEETECPRSKGDTTRRLFVPGHYEIQNGGIDTLPSLNYAYELVLKHHELGADVLYEGKNFNDSLERIKIMHQARLDVRVVFIDHPITKCIQAVHDRGHNIKQDTIIALDDKSKKEFVKLRTIGVKCRLLSRQGSFQTIRDWLQQGGNDARPGGS
jgi:hypothetical protein